MSDTDHVIAAIDGALADWTSPDAMRWTPADSLDRPSLDDTVGRLQRAMAMPLDEHGVLMGFPTQTVFDAEQFASVVERARAALRSFRREMTALSRTLAQIHVPLPAERPTDPREHALQARRSRNTGPDHDPFTHRGMSHDQQYRPRHHDQHPGPGRADRPGRRRHCR